MLERAESLKEVRTTAHCSFLLNIAYALCLKFIPKFIYEMGCAESDRERRNKLLQLDLTDSEWERVGVAVDLLAVCA